MNIRLANMADLPQLKAVYRKIIEKMNQENIQIWDEIFPCEFFKEDIEKQCLYILEDCNKIAAAFSLFDTDEGAAYLRLFVVDINIPAIKLYEKNGFKRAEGIYDLKVDDDRVLQEFGYEKRITEEVYLCLITKELCHEFYQEYENDPAVFMDMSLFSEYEYDEKKVDEYFVQQQDASRVVFIIMKDGKPIGEIKLKYIDNERQECSLGIHLQNDSVKGKGYGTYAEKLALQYAFEVLGMKAVNADAVLKNVRSQHVLEKVGFEFVREDDTFKYYRYEFVKWKGSHGA